MTETNSQSSPQISIEKVEPCVCKMTITVGAADVDIAFADVTKTFQKKAKLQGFRPGKAPLGMVKKMYAVEIAGQAAEKVVQSTLFPSLMAEELSPVARPEVQYTDNIIAGAEFCYSAVVEIRPEITLAKYTGLTFEQEEGGVSDQEIDETLLKMREQAAQMEPVEGRTKSQAGDFVLLNYTGTIDGVAFDGGSADDALIEVGGTGYLPEFSAGIEDIEVPGEKDVSVTFPDDYGSQDLAGKTASFHMAFRELKHKAIPAADDEFAQDMGKETLVELKASISENLAGDKKEQLFAKSRQSVLKSLVEQNPIDVPPSLVVSQTDRMIEDASQRMAQMMGGKFSPESLDMGSLRDSLKGDAKFFVSSGLLLSEVTSKESIEISDDEVTASIKEEAARAGVDYERALSYYTSSGRLEQVKYKLLEDKTVRWLMGNGTAVEPTEESTEE